MNLSSSPQQARSYVRDLHEIDRTQIALAGGKGAQLGELTRIEGIHVPAGFCVTTAAFRQILVQAPSVSKLLEQMSCLRPDQRAAIHALSDGIRQAIEAIAIPDDLATEITEALARLGTQVAYAVRSSATAEDLPTASFAGQHDSYLTISGPAAVLRHISRCWASLFTERAVSYRLRGGFDPRKVHMAVVVQQMVLPQVSGVLFTADPFSGNRKVCCVEACVGLGEALVAGKVNADAWQVRDGVIVARTIASRQPALHASPTDGTYVTEAEHHAPPALTDAQILRIAQQGRRIEAHFGSPQDIEWCLCGDEFHIVQSRPITTLFPLPAAGDAQPRVYVSVGHQQMMIAAMRPLGISVKQLTARPVMHEAGGRLFVDVTRGLAAPASRAGLLQTLGKSDPLLRDALERVLESGFIPLLPEKAGDAAAPVSAPAAIKTDPAIVAALIARSQASLADLKRDIRAKSGAALLDFILADFQEMKRILFDPQSLQAIIAGMEASWWLNDQLQAWLGEKNAADTLTRSVPGNITSEMGLALLEVADVIRPHAAVVAFLQQNEGVDFLDALAQIPGGSEARHAIQSWLTRYGMRGAGEIDITNPRWSERPGLLVPILLGHIHNFAPGAAARRFAQGRQEAAQKEKTLLQRLRKLPDGEHKAAETRRVIARLRTFIGYREYPKYGMVCRLFVYKQALLQEAARLLQAGVLREQEDIFYLSLHELREAVLTQQVDEQRIAQRKQAFKSCQALTPPRVLTSDGECINGAYRRGDLPTGALAGLAVSAGTVEGRARVIFAMDQADLEADDILVTTCTDPSWTPLFVGIKGLVTEAGGLMTHGAVIAREYGLPAVVGVEHATRQIRDGQRIRIDGMNGYVEILS
jgi:rifampicin phosphotransferase